MNVLRPVIVVVLVLVCLMAAAPAALAQAAPGDLLWSYLSAGVDDDAARAVAVAPEGYFVGAIDGAIGQVNSSVRVHAFTADVMARYAQNAGADDMVPQTVAALALAPDGAPFLAGWTTGPSASQDFLVTSFDRSANFTGMKTYDGPAHGADVALAVATDSSGACYVTGSSQSKRASGDQDIVTIRYDADGTRAWAKRFDGTAHGLDRPAAIAVRSGYVYVAGRSRRTGHADDVVLIKYNALTGGLVWTASYDDAQHRNDRATDLVVTSGAAYIGGMGRSGGTSAGDALVVKFGLGGAVVWAKYTGGTAGLDVWNDIEWSARALRTTGSLVRGDTGSDVMTAKWRPDGTLAWRTTFSTVEKLTDAGVALATDRDGNTFVACESDNMTDADIRVLAYGPDGDTLWLGEPFGAFAGLRDVPADIAVAGTCVAVVGTSGTPLTGDDYLFLTYEK
jgi:hypothetical protein